MSGTVKRKSLGRFIATAACAVALAACQQSPSAPSALNGAASQGTANIQHEQDLPFSGTMTGTTQYDQANPRGCPFAAPFPVTTVSDATGTASHLGLASFHTEHCVTAGGMVGDILLTAANGDKIYGTYVLQRTAPFPAIGGYIQVGGTMTFSGGTGRFEQASGTAEMTGSILWGGFVPSTPFPGEWKWTGRISY
jgi:hypothetical protein